MVDDVRHRHDLHRGDLVEPHLVPAGRVDEGRPHVEHAVTVGRHTPELHVVRLASLEDVAGLLSGDEPGGGPAHVARLEPVLLGGGEIDFDLNLRDVLLELHVVLLDAGYGPEDVIDHRGLAP